MNLRGGFRRAEAAARGPRRPTSQSSVVAVAAVRRHRRCAREAAIGVEAPIAPIAVDLFGEAGVQREAPPRQGFERAAVAPVERQEAARLAGGGAGDARPLDDDRLRAAAG